MEESFQNDDAIVVVKGLATNLDLTLILYVQSAPCPDRDDI